MNSIDQNEKQYVALSIKKKLPADVNRHLKSEAALLGMHYEDYIISILINRPLVK